MVDLRVCQGTSRDGKVWHLNKMHFLLQFNIFISLTLYHFELAHNAPRLSTDTISYRLKSG